MKINSCDLTRLALAVSLHLLLGLSQAAAAESGKMVHSNSKTPGEAINLQQFLSKSAQTLLFVHSPHCGPCKRVEPKIKALAKAKAADLKIVELLLDGPKDSGIGWDSPAAKQFDVHAVPAYLLYDRSGELLLKGDPAEVQVDKWMYELGIKKDEPKS